ncbi:DUF7551 domain-containing protein [Halogeometricum borinquense]|uniref:DUF7551 domain-containing protein n=1 Tax=Halogeometricum borinquense TaxID=60847 RepID=UPI00341EFE54
MVGGTLREIRSRVRGLSVPTGSYAVVCTRTGREPIPLTGMRFDSRDDAEHAADAAKDYRSALRRYDPQVLQHESEIRNVADADETPQLSATHDRAVRLPANADPRTYYLSFCHDVSGAVFEALTETGYRTVESAAMETYLTLAEVVTEQDDFCLTLLWSVMSELDVRLDAPRQRRVVSAAASLLAGPNDGAFLAEPTVESALEATMTRLNRASFVGEFDIAVCSSGEAWEVTFAGYSLAERTGRLPTLPVAVDLIRRLPDDVVSFTEATPLANSRWRVRVERDSEPTGLVSLDATDEGRLNDTDYRI